MSDMNTNTNYNLYGAERTYGSSKGVSYTSSSKNELDINDFIQIFTTELTNQDILSSDSSGGGGGSADYIAQMAQFTTLETMKTMTEIIYAQYGSSVVGKDVVVAGYDALGNYSEDRGVVDRVSLIGGDVTISVNGTSYPMSSIMEILSPEAGASDKS